MNEAVPRENDALEELVAEATDLFLERVHNGERPDVEEHARRFPQVAEMLRELLPAVSLMHSSNGGADRISAGADSLPPGANTPGSPGLLGTLGDFRLVREIGRGGMGVVYEAEQVSLGRRVALKVLPMAAALDPRQLQRFRLEAQAAAHLHHANIVAIHSVGCERSVYFYAMQFVEGRSLEEVIGQLRQQNQEAAPKSGQGPATEIDPAEAGAETTSEPLAIAATVQSIRTPAYFSTVANLGIQAAEALDYAHGMGVVHRDIKPGNLLLDAQNKLYVTDFGLARLQGDAGLTMTGDLVGTLRYMSPEQALGQRGVVDHHTDIYSLGATLYELLTLAPVFAGSDRAHLLRRIVEEDPVAPRQQNRAVPEELETIVLKALAKEPQRRYASARDLADDLKRFLEHRPILARRPTLVERTAKWARRHRSLVAAGVCLLLLSALGFAVSTALIAREQWKTQAAFKSLAKEQARTKEAFEAEAAQRDRAEASFQQARKIVDYFTEVSEEELADKPELQALRRKLLSAALDYYRDFIDQRRDDPSLQAQLAASHLRVAGILDEVGSREEALDALEKAKQLQEKLVRSKPAVPELQGVLLAIYSRSGLLRGGRELQLLTQRAVQEDLQLSEEQAKTVAELWDRRREAFRPATPEEWQAKFEELSAQEKTLADLLQPEQTRRLGQLALQQRGTEALSEPEVAKTLKLSEDQQKKIHALLEDTRRSLWAGRSGDFRAEDWKKVEDAWKHTRERVLAVLTDEQQTQWQEMIGAPFKGHFRSPHHRGGFGPWRGPRGLKKS